MTRVKLSDFSDVAAVTFWQVMQSHLRECQRLNEEAYQAEIRGLESSDIRQEAEAYSNAFTALSQRYEAFKTAVKKLAPDAFTRLPLARCGDCLSVDARQAALACELAISADSIMDSSSDSATNCSSILPENRSRPMTKIDAASYLNLSAYSKSGKKDRNAVRELNRLIEIGRIRAESAPMKKYIFDVTGFPEESQKAMRL